MGKGIANCNVSQIIFAIKNKYLLPVLPVGVVESDLYVKYPYLNYWKG
jgi:hypothetical protein